MPRYRASDEEWEEDEDLYLDILPGQIEVGEPEEPACILDRWGDPIPPTTNPIGFGR